MKLLNISLMVVAVFLTGCGGGNSTTAGSGAPASAGTVDRAALYASLRTGGKLMLHQRDALALTPAQLQSRLATADAVLDAFDGVFLRLPTVSDAVMKNTALDLAAITTELAPIATAQPTHLRHNFAIVTVQRDLDAFDDWTVVLRNFSNLARAVRDAGLVGIVIDNESPTGLRVAFPADVKSPALPIESYRTQTQDVGRRIMQALATEFPDIAVIVLRGPAAAEAQTPRQLVVRAFDSAQLLGSFFAGFVEGRDARSLVVDGGSDYGLRIDDQFAASRAWRKTGIATMATNSPFVLPALRAAWPTAVSAAFGVREIDGAQANRLPNLISVWENTVSSALRNSDVLVWASFDTSDLSRAAAGDPWPTAARRAKAAGTGANGRLASVNASSGTGLMAQYYTQIDQTDLAQTVVDQIVDWTFDDNGFTSTNFPQAANYSLVWSGYLEATVTGTYTFFGTTDDGMRITLGGVSLFNDDAYRFQGATEYSADVSLQAGFRYPIKVEFFQGGGPGRATVEWLPPGGLREVIPPRQLYATK